MDGVYAIGDIVRGASLVVWAIRDGREAADAILERFGRLAIAAE
jgi:glutamate synthase (NADPH/NADH) small chain